MVKEKIHTSGEMSCDGHKEDLVIFLPLEYQRIMSI